MGNPDRIYLQFTKFLFVFLAIVLLVQVVPAMANGPDHRPEEWEIQVTSEAASQEIRQPERLPRATATAIPQPYPIETHDPYPMPEQSRIFEWLRILLWKVE